MASAPQKKKPARDSAFFLDFVRVTGCIPGYLYKRPRIHYAGDRKKCRPKGGVLIVSNHITFSDPILLYLVFWYRRLHFLATKDLYKNRFVGFLFDLVGCIQVDKDNFSIRSLHTVVDKLRIGKAILIFPEGQVNGEKQTLSFKAGAAMMAHLSGVPIQPVYLVRRTKWYRPSEVVVGEPVDIAPLCSRFPTMEELQRVTEHIHADEAKLQQYYLEQVLKKKGETV